MTGNDSDYGDQQYSPDLVARPFMAVGGRTQPDYDLDIVSLVRATGQQTPHVQPEAAAILSLCRPSARSIAELAAALDQPFVVIKILVSDLITSGAVIVSSNDQRPDLRMLEAIRDGLANLDLRV
jgi:hypothetical protein